jgi:hypothetical protein
MNVKPISIRKSFPSGDEIAPLASAGKEGSMGESPKHQVHERFTK